MSRSLSWLYSWEVITYSQTGFMKINKQWNKIQEIFESHSFNLENFLAQVMELSKAKNITIVLVRK